MSGTPFGIGELIVGIQGADEQRSATNQAADAESNALAESKRQFDLQIARQEPFYQQGLSSLADFAKMIKGGSYDMKESPSAKYQLAQGTKAMNRALSVRGLSGSGNAVNRITELNQSVAASDWKDQYSRILDSLKLGTGAAASMGAASATNSALNQTGAQNLAQIYQNAGNARASLWSGMGGVMNNTGNDIYRGISQGMKQYNANNTANDDYNASFNDAGDAYSGGADYGFM